MIEGRAALEQVIASLPYRTWAAIPGNRTDASKVTAEMEGERRPQPSANYARGLVRLARVHPADPTVPSSTSGLSPVWQADGVFTRSLSSFNGASRTQAHNKNWRAVYVQLLHSANAQTSEAEIPVFLREGWTAVGWGTYGQHTDPHQDGRDAAAICRRVTTLRGWKANGEAWAEKEHAWKTSEFLSGWHAGGSPVPLGWSVLSSDTAIARSYDFATALSVPGADIDIQAYGASNPGYTVNAGLAMLEKAKVPRERTAMSFNVSDGGTGPFADYRTWRGPRRIWVGESATLDTWNQLEH